MPSTSSARTATEADCLAARELVERIEHATGERPLSDQLWSALRVAGSPTPANGASLGVVPAPDGSSSIQGFAIVAPDGTHWTLAVVEPIDRPLTEGQRAALVGHVLATAGVGAPVHWWATDPTPATGRTAVELGLTGRRALHRMRRTLPTGLAVTIATRPFVVGEDEDEWLRVNRRAFAHHPEQGAWDHETLHTRMAEPWFDPAGFLLHHREGRLAGFCWTKVHPAAAGRAPSGEIYVIAVDPDFHGMGLGRALTLAGLDHLAGRGIADGMLYVEADNDAAVQLYRRLGFHVERTDVAFVGTPTIATSHDQRRAHR